MSPKELAEKLQEKKEEVGGRRVLLQVVSAGWIRMLGCAQQKDLCFHLPFSALNCESQACPSYAPGECLSY